MNDNTQISIQPDPAGPARKEERPSYPGVNETLLKGVITLSEEGGAYTAHEIEWPGLSSRCFSRQPVIYLQAGCMKLADQVLAQSHLYFLPVFRLYKDAVKESCPGAYFEPGLG